MVLNLEPILALFVLVLTWSPTPGRGAQASSVPKSSCLRRCGEGKETKWVPYPFGFSTECPIQLECSSSNGISIGGFHVRNITSNGALLEFPAQCNRSIDAISRLFGRNYALSVGNSLLLQNCTNQTLDVCLISMSSILSDLKVDSCGSGGDNISCYPSERHPSADVLNFQNVNSSNCKVLFSSFAVGTGDQAESFVFQRLRLEWWLGGGCPHDAASCSKDANCTNVKLLDGRTGFKCVCNEGFVGDGFLAGDGCRRESDCSASKYMGGVCGETTRVGMLVGGLVAGASLMAMLVFGCYFYRRRSNSLRSRLSAKRLISAAAGNSSVPMFQYKEIERATSGFSEKQRLGTGAYGTVYAGKLNTDDWVAIKRIRHKDTDSIDQVMNEIKLLSSVSHPNLVRLLGCCIEEGEQILVYEFMPNGTLCQHLQRERGNGLPWTIRLTIASETANAIAYLHSAMNPPIYHRDIKSSNILLDFNYRSKVADFGLSRLGLAEISHISTAPQGTPGYLDPQYHQYFHLSDKSDVYSFGVVLAEIITGSKVVDFSRSNSEVNLAALAVDRIGRGCVDEIIDSYIDPQRDAWTLSSIHSVAELAFRCLAFHRDMRPTMMEVAEELEQIRLSAWVPNMYVGSSVSSFGGSENGSETSVGVPSTKSTAGARKVAVPQRKLDNLPPFEEVKDSSPVSIHDPWQSEPSSPSTNSLLNNIVQ